MKKRTLFTVVFSLFMAFGIFAQKSFINPAAAYCDKLGYRYEVTSETKGEDGMVYLPDGQRVNAWDFYKGKVGQQFSYGAKKGYTVYCEKKIVDGCVIEEAVCVKKDKGATEKISQFDLMERHGDALILHDRTFSSDPIYDASQYDPNFPAPDALPTSFDWRNYNGNSYIGTPRNQGNCGSCYSFGAAACAEGTYNFATGKYGSNVADFSEAYIVWCLSQMSPYSGHFGGCNGADYDYMELQALCDIGIVNESVFPYQDVTSATCPTATQTATKTKFKNWYRVPCNDVNAIKTAIMTYGVVDAAVYVTSSFQSYSGGVFSDNSTTCTTNPCYNTPTNHAISLVGWGNDPTKGDYWILRNSWGTSWGESGYMRIAVTSARVGCSVCYMVYENDNTTTPTVATNSVTNIGNTSATCGGNITSNGGATVTQSGLVYSTSANPTTSSGTVISTSPVVTSGSYTLSMSGLTEGTKYYVRAFATNAKGTSYGTETNFTTAGTPPIVYCASKGNSVADEWIAKVQVGTFSNTSTGQGYTDFTSKTINMTAGTGYSLTLTPGFSGSAYNEYWRIWVDLNKDGDFDDSGEMVFDAGAVSNTVKTGTVTIPAATTAKTTRMRVSMKYNGAPTACETFSYGEVEDYTVNITANVVNPPVAQFTASATSILVGQSVTFTDQTTNNPTSWSWSFQGGTPSTSSAQNPTVTYNTAGTYQVALTATNSAGSNTMTKSAYITVTGVPTYCASQGNNCTYEWISKVQIGSYTKTSTATKYSDFTSNPISITTSSVSFTLTPSFKSTTYNEVWCIFIDYNKDGDFTDAGETVYTSALTKTAVSGSFTIPSTFSGQTRMRISMKYNGTPTSCEAFGYGEVEDYTINVTRSFANNGETINAVQESDFQIYPNPTSATLNVVIPFETAVVKVVSATGSVVRNIEMNSSFDVLNVADLPNGVYIIYVENENNRMVKRFIKQ